MLPSHTFAAVELARQRQDELARRVRRGIDDYEPTSAGRRGRRRRTRKV